MFISLKFTVNKYPTSFINAISFHRITLNCLLHHIIDTDPKTATTVYSIDDNPGRLNNYIVLMVFKGLLCWYAIDSSGAHCSDGDCIIVLLETGKWWWGSYGDDYNIGKQ